MNWPARIWVLSEKGQFEEAEFVGHDEVAGVDVGIYQTPDGEGHPRDIGGAQRAQNRDAEARWRAMLLGARISNLTAEIGRGVIDTRATESALKQAAALLQHFQRDRGLQ